MPETRLLHIEDDPLWAELIEKAARELPGVSYVGRAASRADAVASIEKNAPHILIVDLRLPDGDGFHVIRRFISDKLAPKVILLTVRTDEASLYQAWSLRVAAIVWKNVAAIQHVHQAVHNVI